MSFLDPALIYEKAQLGEEGFRGALDLFPANFDPRLCQPEFSGKMQVLDYILAITKTSTNDKVRERNGGYIDADFY